MAFNVRLGDFRPGGRYYQDIQTGPGGIRYTTDTQGNPIIIAPDEPIKPGEIPTYEKTKAAWEPKGMETGGIDPRTGEPGIMYETPIAPHLFDPTLAQRESDLALISGKAGGQALDPKTGELIEAPPIGTELTRGKEWEGRPSEKKTFVEPETGATKLMPGVEPAPQKVSEIEKQKIEAASQRLSEGIKPPGGPELPETDEIDWFDPNLEPNFKARLDQKLGGDPHAVDLHTEAMNVMPDWKVKDWYMDNWTDEMPTWFDLSKSAQAQTGTKLRSDILAQLTYENGEKIKVHDHQMKLFREQVLREQKAIKRIAELISAGKKETRAEAASQRAATRSENYIKNEIMKLEGERDESFNDEERERLGVRIAELKKELKDSGTAPAVKKEPGAKDKEKPVSTQKTTEPGKKPGWVQVLERSRKIKIKTWAAKQDESGQKYLVFTTEDGKQHALKQTK